ncbi:MAG: CoA transferase [Deltaproteobacteria bacterium]|nr:CoA transferase [Deltaproteobacteria bacterium]
MQGLEGVRVLELGHLVSAAYATKLMAGLGAEVIKIEEPQGDQARQRGPFPAGAPHSEKSGLFLALNTNKRGVTLDLRQPQGKEQLQRLLTWADILVHNYAPPLMSALGLNYDTFHQRNPRLVMCSITPFGLSGPYRDYKAHEITLAHGGGWAWLSPGASDQPELPPLKACGHQADFQGALAATVVTLGAYYRALETGTGEHIDLSGQEFVASFLEQNFVYYTYMGQVASRLGRRLLYPWGIYECQDGLIFLVNVEQDQWQRLIELMGDPEWASWEIFKDPFVRAENSDVLKPYIEEWIKQWKVEDLWRAGQERRICFSPVFSMAQLAKQEQLRARNFFVEVTHPQAGTLTHLGPPYQLREPWWKIRRPAPLLGEHNEEVKASLGQIKTDLEGRRTPDAGPRTLGPHLPLEGIRVSDFSWAWAGPFCAMHLAHLGAEVIKIESQVRPDLGRRVPIYPSGLEPSFNRSGYFNQWNQGKKSILLNLSKRDALEIVRKLIATCDVVVDNFATGVMEHLGLGYEDLKQLKPDIIMASIAGYGHTGPQQKYMGYGPAVAPLTGLSSLTGYPDGSPQEVGISYGDPNGGINAAVAICAALVARKRTGKGQYIDVSLWEAVAALVHEGWMDYAMNGAQPARSGNRDLWMSPHNCFRCAGEDEWVTIACGSNEEWQALCQAIGQPQFATDPRFRTAVDRKTHEDELEVLLTAWTAQRGKWEVTHTLQAAGVAAFPSMNSKDLAEDRHLNERGFFARLPHGEVGVQTHAGIPWRFTNAPNGVRTPAPLLGADTDTVMRDLLGYSAQEIARLKAEQVLY